MAKTILVVDDSAMIQRIVCQLIRQLGFDVMQADNGRTGYEAAKSKKPDLIIMDIEMPEMTGIEATAKIKADPELASIPVLFFTSLGREEDIDRARSVGGDGFLNKPVCKNELSETIREFISI